MRRELRAERGKPPTRSLLRQPVLRLWREVELPLLLLLGMAAVILGLVGFHKPPRADGWSWWDSAYRTAQLFVLDFDLKPLGKVSTELHFARFLAAFVAGYAILRAITAAFHEQLGLAWMHFARNHVVIAGLSDKGFQLVKAFHDAGVRLAVIEADSRGSAITGCRQRGVPVLRGDATDKAMLKRAGIGHASCLVAAAGDDGTNLDIAFTAGELKRGRRRARLTAVAHLDDLALWRLLSTRGLESAPASTLRLDFFNLFELSAQVLLDAHPPFEHASRDGRGPPRVAVVGTEGIGRHVILHVCRTWRNTTGRSGERFELSVLGSGSASECRSLAERHPELSSIATLSAYDLEIASPDFPHSGVEREAPARHDIIYVCLPDGAEGLAATLSLQAATRGRCSIIFVTREEDVGSATVFADEEISRNIHVFGMLTRSLTPDLVARGTSEVLARATHEHYVAAEQARGVTSAENPSLVRWKDLPEALKHSNRRFSDGISQKLGAAGCAVVPAPLADATSPSYSFSHEQVERLAVMEHDRWVRDLLDDGWRWAVEKDPYRRRHPKLVPWDELTDQDREKDRSAIRSMPAILARAGFEIVEVDGAQAVGG